MRTVVCVYVDHQKKIGYPVAYVTENLAFADRIWLFGSDLENTEALVEETRASPLQGKMAYRTLGMGILSPDDIATAQNRMLDTVRAEDPHDYCLVLQADTRLLQSGVERISQLVQLPDYLTKAALLVVQHVRLHCVAHRTVYGSTLVGSKFGGRFVGDGAYPEPYVVIDGDTPHCLDVGYYSAEAYCRHVSKHKDTWPSAQSREVARSCASKKTRGIFLRIALTYLHRHEFPKGNKPTLYPLEGEYGELVRRMDLQSEHREIGELLSKMRFDHQ